MRPGLETQIGIPLRCKPREIMGTAGRKDRTGRLVKPRSGVWVSSSADFIDLVRRLYAHSVEYSQTDGNRSPYTLAGIPMLFSALRCTMVEHASYPPRNEKALDLLSGNEEFAKMLAYYDVPQPLSTDANLLHEVRHEILHPAHLPPGTPDNWPEYLRPLKHRKLLQSTQREADYDFLSQLWSHRLFAWSCHVVRDLAERILTSDGEKAAGVIGHLGNYDSLIANVPRPV